MAGCHLAVRCLVMLLVLSGTVLSLAQEPSPPDVTSDADASTAEETKPSSEPTLLDRLIYLPYKDLKTALDQHTSTVIVPYQEYLRLWRQSQGGTRPIDETAKTSAVITSASYSAEVQKNRAVISAEFTIQVLGKPVAMIPVQFGNAALGAVTTLDEAGNPVVDDADNANGMSEKVLLRGTGNGTYEFLLPKQGTHRVQLELISKVRSAPEGKSLELTVPTVGITRFELSVPESDQTIELTPNVATTQLQGEANQTETRIRANIGSTRRIIAKWHTQAGSKPEMELLTSVENDLRVRIGDGLVHTDATLVYRILRGELSKAEIQVPAGHRVLDVSSPSARLKGWRATEKEGRQLITVETLSPVRETLTLEVHTEASQPEEAFPVAGVSKDGTVFGIHSTGVVRESGKLTVSHGSEISLNVEKQEGLTRTDAGPRDKGEASRGLFTYRFYQSQFQLLIQANKVQPRLVAANQSRWVLRKDRIELQTNLNYTIERAGVFELNLQLPENLEIDSVNATNMKEYHVDEKSRQLIVSLNSRHRDALPIQITGHTDIEIQNDERRYDMPVIRPLNVQRESGQFQLYAPPAIDVVTRPQDIQGLYPASQTSAPPVNNARFVASWTFHRQPVALAARLVRRPTRLTADIGTVVSVHEEQSTVQTTLTYHVEHAGVDTFRFAVPEAVSQSVQIESVGDQTEIKQKTRDEVVEDGWSFWTVVTRNEILGDVQFLVRYDIKPTSEDEAKPGDNAAADNQGEAEQIDAGDGEAGDESDAEAGEENESPPKRKTALVIDQPLATGREEGQVIRVYPIRVQGLPAGEEGQPELPLARVVGEVAVSSDQSLSLSVHDLHESVEAIDIRELTRLSGQGSLAFRYFRQPVSITLESEKHKIQEVVETVVSRALIEVVIGRDQTATYRCRYRMKSSERQRLAVDFPEGFVPLNNYLDGQAVDLEMDDSQPHNNGWELRYVNVARTKNSNEEFWLTFHLRTKTTAFASSAGLLNLQFPRIGNHHNGNVVQQQLRTVIWMPDDITLIRRSSRFSRDELIRHRLPKQVNAVLEEWIGGGAGGMVEFPSQGKPYAFSTLGAKDSVQFSWWNTVFYTWFISGTLVVVGFVLRRTSWENKLGILLLVAFVAALYALKDVETVMQTFKAAQYGLIVMLGIWMIHALFGRRLQPAVAGVATSAVTNEAPDVRSSDDVRSSSPETKAGVPSSKEPSVETAVKTSDKETEDNQSENEEASSTPSQTGDNSEEKPPESRT